MKPSSQPARILIADDDDVVSVGLSALLRRRGFEIDIVRDLSGATDEAYDVVILDPLLSDGVAVEQFVRDLRATNPSIAVLVASEFIDDPASLHVLEASRVLVKPASIAHYAQTVEEVIRSRRQGRIE